MTAAYLDRFVDEQRLLAASEHPGQSEEQMPYLRYMAQTGKRVAEMHLALASCEEIADFAPEASRPEDVERWIEETMTRAERVFDALQQRRDAFKEVDRQLIDQLLSLRSSLRNRLGQLVPPDIDNLNIRHHGDFHLGQMLIVKDDIFIIDFEGEPRRPHERAPAQGTGRTRRRRPGALDRLFRDRGVRARAQNIAGRARQACNRTGGMARQRDRGVFGGLPRGDDASATVARRPAGGRGNVELLPDRKSGLRNRIRAGPSSGLAACSA